MPENEDCKLQKYMAQCGVASRRACETLIEEGKVLVNGKRAALGDRVRPGMDRVEYLGQALLLPQEEHKYLMLNKPKGTITTASDEKGRATVMECVKEISERVYPIGRLDCNTEGLLLFTNDGEFANMVMHPKFKVEKQYEVMVSGEPTQRQLEQLREPIEIDGRLTSPAGAEIVEKFGNKTKLIISIHEGRNHQVKRLLERSGLLLRKLRRVSIGELLLGELPAGKWRELSPKEVKDLIRICGY